MNIHRELLEEDDLRVGPFAFCLHCGQAAAASRVVRVV
jgi:hypothetical protein